jgi:hypothetical protein
VSGAVDGNLALLHRFEECALSLGGRTVDLVAEHDVGEDGAGPELELPGLLVEDVRPGDVGGKQIGRELHPRKGTLERARDRPREHGLADAGDVLQQDVAAAQHCGHDVLDRVVAADDHLLGVPDDGSGEVADLVDRQPVGGVWTGLDSAGLCVGVRIRHGLEAGVVCGPATGVDRRTALSATSGAERL